MTRLPPRLLAACGWTVAVVVIVCIVASARWRALADADPLFALLEGGISTPVAGAIGALIVSRRPRNVVGWLLLVIALGWAIQDAAAAYTHLALAETGEAEGALLWIAWIGSYGWVVAFPVAIILLPLLYPDGRAPSRRWRPVLWLAVVVTVLTPVQALQPGPLELDGVVVGSNPAGMTAASAVGTAFEGLLIVAFPLLLAAGVTSQVVRFRRSQGVERQQIKWLVAPFSLVPVVLVLTMFDVSEIFGRVFGGFVLTAIFACIGLAVLRYRLYEIDRIVGRTVSYALMTAVLVGVYVSGVVVLGTLVRGIAGDGGGDLVVAASTLLVAAAFGPVRRRVQHAVDRRFDRSRYDAQRTVEEFGQRLRDEVELGLLADDLRTVASATVRPSSVSLWLTQDPGAPT